MASPAIGRVFAGPDTLERSVWVVVEPRDFVAGRRMTAPVEVRLRDVTAEPIAGLSGVYCFTDLNLPVDTYTVDVRPLSGARDHYFDGEGQFLLDPIPVPGQPLKRNPVSVDLLPRPAYPFAGQETLARGRLVKASDGTGVERANVFLILASVDQGLRGRTDERGAFVVCFPPTEPEDNAAAGAKDFTFQLRFEIASQPPLLIAAEIVREGTTIALTEILVPGI